MPLKNPRQAPLQDRERSGPQQRSSAQHPAGKFESPLSSLVSGLRSISGGGGSGDSPPPPPHKAPHPSGGSELLGSRAHQPRALLPLPFSAGEEPPARGKFLGWPGGLQRLLVLLLIPLAGNFLSLRSTLALPSTRAKPPPTYTRSPAQPTRMRLLSGHHRVPSAPRADGHLQNCLCIFPRSVLRGGRGERRRSRRGLTDQINLFP